MEHIKHTIIKKIKQKKTNDFGVLNDCNII